MNEIEQAIKLLNEVEQKKSETKNVFENLPDLIATNEFNQLTMLQNKTYIEQELEDIEEGMLKIVERDAETDTEKKLSSEVKRKAEVKRRLTGNPVWIEKNIELKTFSESLRKNEIDTDRLKRKFRVLECFFRMEE